MSYESVIIGKEPDLYVPFRSFSEEKPIEIIKFRAVNVVGPVIKSKKNGFPKNFIQLVDSYIEMQEDSPFFAPPATYIVWFSKFQQSGPVMFVGDEESGFGMSVDENFNLVAFYNGDNTETFSINPDDSFHMLSIVIDYDDFSGEDFSYKALFYFDKELILEEYLDIIPEVEDIYLNASYSGETSSGAFAHMSSFSRALNLSEIENIYDIATTGRQKIVVSEETNIPFADTQQTAIQTSWQAYGIVTGKI